MSASNKMAKMSVDTIIRKIKAQVDRIQALKAFRVREYARQLSCMLEQGEKALQVYDQWNTEVVSMALSEHALRDC